ncbi:hypothetical protein EIN_532030 [Entamoeba invadens IP1]|uniref:Uncharacterized protein n=1 Tax=Entamoeba invadens IP1 TaxID=370355 RepID=L7FLM8_ENTIV|nr:hypothetical protein EIN_532030 [Entamoeba invadens IP1]ELP88723.1 hypothetical protein EIN_532030 [Entamoeba invadens IP1]|eukprot:XP_004255494.1 hypothetical protein EIN_532030 [Entamoeba invadens IP1]
MLNGNFAMQTTLFNYPDCIYNSSDLDLYTTNTDTTTTIGDLNVWNTIIFMKSYQLLIIGTDIILNLNTLFIIQGGCYFYGSVSIKHSIIYYKTIFIYFDTTPSFGHTTGYLKNDVIFYFKTKSSSFNLITDVTKCEHAVMHSDSDCSTSQKCYLNGSSIVTTANTYNGKTNLFCGLNTLPFLFDLVFCSTFGGSYKISGESYWNQLYCLATYCNLSSTNVINIKRMVVDNTFGDLILNTDIDIDCFEFAAIKTYYLTRNINIATLKINIQNNMNTNILFVINNGTLTIQNIEIGSSMSSCFDVVSSKNSITEYSSIKITNSNYKIMTDLLSQKLLRICPINKVKSATICIEKTTATSITSEYKYPHCPCTQSNCVVQFSGDVFNLQNVELQGTLLVKYHSSTMELIIKNINFINLLKTEYGMNNAIHLYKSENVKFGKLTHYDSTQVLKFDSPFVVDGTNILKCALFAEGHFTINNLH